MSEDEWRAMLGRDILERINALEDEIAELRTWKETHAAQYAVDAPAISVLHMISGFSKVAQWLIAGMIGLLAAVATIGVAIDTVRGWLK